MNLCCQNINNSLYNQSQLTFNADKKKGVLDRPIQDVQNVIETGVNTIINKPDEDIKKKKRRTRAIAASSTVLVLSSLTLLLNPRSSGKLGKKLKSLQEALAVKIKQSGKGTFKNDVLNFGKKVLSGVEKAGNVYFNLNSGKDWLLDSFCTNMDKKYPEFLKKNSMVYNATKKVDRFCVKVFKTPHEAITRWFDGISKNTVKGKYKKALREMNSLEITLKSHKESLSREKQLLVEQKLKEIAKIKEAFNEENVLIRLKKQENLMADLKDDFAQKIYNKKDGLCKNKTSFWARDILAPKKMKVEKEGTELVEKLFGKKGLYDETINILSENLNEKQINTLKRELKNASKKLNKANVSECVEYFDKKRDLTLGGAPTDILTQIFGIGLCGVLVTKAEKEDRLSKLFTNGVPIITGLLSSLIFSAKLYAGAKSILAGAAVTGITDVACGIVNKYVFGNKDEDDEEDSLQKSEVKNA